MRIVYLEQYYNSPSMPGGSRVYEMARRWVQAGHQVDVVTSYRLKTGHTTWFHTEEDGIDLHWLPVPYDNTMSFRRRIVSFFRFAFSAGAKAASFDADVIFATSTPLTICIPGVFASRRRKIPMVFEVRDLWPEMPIVIGALRNPLAIWGARWLERFAYRNATRVVGLSPGMVDGIAAAGYPRERIRMIPNSCDLERFSPDSDARERFRKRFPEIGGRQLVLYAGTMGRVNDVAWLARVAEGARERFPDIRFVVFGEGSEAEGTRELARQLGVLGGNFFQYGRLPKDQVVDAFLAADVVASVFAPIPEMEKNSANKFFDGLAAGKPMAINYGGWQAGLLRETGAGLVMDHDPEIAATQLNEFLADSSRLAEAGRASRKLAEERFSRDRLAGQLEAVLQEAVKERRKG